VVEIGTGEKLVDPDDHIADLDGEFGCRCRTACAAQRVDHRERASLEVGHSGVRLPVSTARRSSGQRT
jgi:hypothetical protein